jgi:hypothetical protein
MTSCCIKDCELPVLAIGLCNKHWRRTKAHGSPVSVSSRSGLMKGLPQAERFWLQVVKTDFCWLWSGATDGDGYGVFSAKLVEKTYKKAHRFSLSLATETALDDRLVVLHACDNPRCVNPAHLSLGTTRDNVQDRVAKGRTRKKGQAIKPEIKLTDAQEQLILADPRPYSQIALDFGVDAGKIRNIKSNTLVDGLAVTAGHYLGVCQVKGCELNAKFLGLCELHWNRTTQFGSPVISKRHVGLFRGLPATERFWMQVEKTDGCWKWLGFKDKNGYGRFKGEVAGVTYTNAHRYSYTLHTGEIIQRGMVVMHTCDNPECSNPDHLIVGTPLANMQDKAAKGRSNYSKGEKNSRAKLTAVEAKLILEDPRPYLEIAATFGVAATTVASIKQRVSWKDINAIPAPKAKRIGMRGSKQWNVKLTEDGVREIRKSSLSGKELSLKYGVTQASICDIQKRRSWKHIA